MSHQQELQENEQNTSDQAQNQRCLFHQIKSEMYLEQDDTAEQNCRETKLGKCGEQLEQKKSETTILDPISHQSKELLRQQIQIPQSSTVNQVNMICSLVLSDNASQEENSVSGKNSPYQRQSARIQGRMSANNSPHRGSTSPQKKIRSSAQQIKPESLFEKKSSRFRFVKDWEDKRIQKTAIFMSIFNSLIETMSRMIQESNEFIENLLLFFHDSQMQFQNIAKVPSCQLQEAFGYRPSLTNVSYPSINQALKQVKDSDKLRYEKYADLCKFIEQNISNGLLQKDKANFESSSELFSQLVKEKQTKIQKLEKAAASAFWEYSELFKAAVQQQAKPTKEKPLDIYYQEIVYMHEARQLLEQVREFGVTVVCFIRQLSSLQQSRVQNVGHCLHAYIEKRIETLQQESECQQLSEISQAVSDLEGGWNISVESLLQPEHANYIRKCYERSSEVTGDLLEQFALDFQIMPFEGENFVLLGQFVGQQKIHKHKDIWIPVIISFTLDRYIIVSSTAVSSQSPSNNNNKILSTSQISTSPINNQLSPSPILHLTSSISPTAQKAQPISNLSIIHQQSSSTSSTTTQTSTTEQQTNSNSDSHNSQQFSGALSPNHPESTVNSSKSSLPQIPLLITTHSQSLNISPSQHFLVSKPSSAIYLPESKIHFDTSSMILTIKEAHKRLFWVSHRTHTLQFTNPDDSAEILTLIYSNQTPNNPS